MLLWLWRRQVATAPIGPLAWEPPYAEGAAQKKKKGFVQGIIKTFIFTHLKVSKLKKVLIAQGNKMTHSFKWLTSMEEKSDH